jgi:hypothetical protein
MFQSFSRRSKPEQYTDKIRVKCVAQGHIERFFLIVGSGIQSCDLLLEYLLLHPPHRTTALDRLYHRTTALDRLYHRTTALDRLYHRTTALDRLYHRTTALDRLYHRTTALDRLYHRTTALDRLYHRTTALDRHYHRTTALHLTMYCKQGKKLVLLHR